MINVFVANEVLGVPRYHGDYWQIGEISNNVLGLYTPKMSNSGLLHTRQVFQNKQIAAAKDTIKTIDLLTQVSKKTMFVCIYI